MGYLAILTCLALTAVDGDTVKCDGENFRPMGNGAPYVSGFDAPEIVDMTAQKKTVSPFERWRECLNCYKYPVYRLKIPV